KGFNEDTQELFRWRVASRLEDMNRDLRQFLSSKKHPMAGFKTIQRLDVAQRSPGGRVLRLAIVTDQGTLNLEKDELLLAFEAPNSTLFYLDPIVGANRTIKGYTFVGGGFGHGVGLSQTGSYHLGKLGWSSNRILSFYFPGTQLQPISDAIVFWRDPSVNQVRSEGAK
ncbi:amidase, partial [Leptolyngbya sp. FACHB-36]|nr:amidase [Leptolyngbya sp. FACHB-36]